MKNSNLQTVFALLLMSVFMSSCEAIAGIFKAGMGFGVFIVVAVIALVVIMIMRSRKK